MISPRTIPTFSRNHILITSGIATNPVKAEARPRKAPEILNMEAEW
jgi:hypothetical protein